MGGGMKPAAHRVLLVVPEELLRYERVAMAADVVVGSEDVGLLLCQQLMNR
jgi:hypothetical protein